MQKGAIELSYFVGGQLPMMVDIKLARGTSQWAAVPSRLMEADILIYPTLLSAEGALN